jgi:hypothetical protein
MVVFGQLPEARKQELRAQVEFHQQTALAKMKELRELEELASRTLNESKIMCVSKPCCGTSICNLYRF